MERLRDAIGELYRTASGDRVLQVIEELDHLVWREVVMKDSVLVKCKDREILKLKYVIRDLEYLLELREDSGKTNRKCTKLETEIEALRDDNERQVRNLQREFSEREGEFTAENKRKSTEIAKFERELSGQEERYQDLLLESHREREELKLKNRETEGVLKETQKDLSGKEQRIKTLNLENNEKTSDLRRYEKELNEKAGEIEELTLETHGKNRTIESLQEALRRQDQILAENTTQLSNHKGLLSRKSEELQNLNTQLKNSTKELEHQKSQLFQKQLDFESLILELSQQSESHKASLQGKTQQIDQLSVENQVQSRHLATYTAKLSKSKQKSEERKQSLSTIKEALTSLNSRLLAKKQKIKTLSSTLESAQNENISLTEQLEKTALRQPDTQMKQEIQEKNKQISDLQSILGSKRRPGKAQDSSLKLICSELKVSNPDECLRALQFITREQNTLKQTLSKYRKAFSSLQTMFNLPNTDPGSLPQEISSFLEGNPAEQLNQCVLPRSRREDRSSAGDSSWSPDSPPLTIIK